MYRSLVSSLLAGATGGLLSSLLAPLASLPPVEGWRRMQAVLPTPSNPSNVAAACQYSAVRGDRGGGVQSVSSMPPHSRGRTNSLTYTRSREMVGSGDAPTYQRDEGRGSQRQGTGPRSTLAPTSRRLGEDREQRRVRRGVGGDEEERRGRRGGERRLSAPSSRAGLSHNPSESADQFVIDHLVNLDLVGRGGVGPTGKQTSDSADLQVSSFSHISSHPRWGVET